MTMTDQVLIDDFGRRTVFTGELLVEETTDSDVNLKPQWLEIEVWRTLQGNFVVRRSTFYRIRHLRENCIKADGYDLSPATDDDTYFCGECNKAETMDNGFSQQPRVTIEVYESPEDLILSFKADGRFSNLARGVLADLADLDERVDAAWSTVQVP